VVCAALQVLDDAAEDRQAVGLLQQAQRGSERPG
jgi:hypothetical protein